LLGGGARGDAGAGGGGRIPQRYDGRWRDRPSEAPENVAGHPVQGAERGRR
jgi:hypothetical protein